jgi:hypothetical protein
VNGKGRTEKGERKAEKLQFTEHQKPNTKHSDEIRLASNPEPLELPVNNKSVELTMA